MFKLAVQGKVAGKMGRERRRTDLLRGTPESLEIENLVKMFRSGRENVDSNFFCKRS